MRDITDNPYFSKIVLTVIALVIKILLDAITKGDEELKGLLKLLSYTGFYILPVTIIIWLNLDSDVENTKLTFTLIAFNIGLIVFNYLQSRISITNKIVGDFAKAESDKVKEVNRINEVQVEKVKTISNNQNYILNELSKINDRIINVYIEKMNHIKSKDS